MNCREFLFEFEDRNALSETATLHLNSCPGCQKTSREQAQVWQMIDGLSRVEAPKNFDFHLKARIANASASDFKPRFLPVLRYVLPLGAIVLVFSLIVFNTLFLNDKTGVPQVAESSVPVSLEKENTPNQISIGQADLANNLQTPANENPVSINSDAGKQPKQSIIKREETEFAAVKSPKNVPASAIPKASQENFTGSRDFSSTTAPEKLPKGLNANKKIDPAPNVSGVKTITTAQVLSELGIETVLENGKRMVRAVRQNSLGEMSGVKNGDIIEAIDGKKLTDEFASGKKIEGKTLTVTRGTEKVEVPLRNQ